MDLRGAIKSFFEWAISCISSLFSVFSIKYYTILEQINVKNVHSVSSTRIRTHNILIMSLFP